MTFSTTKEMIILVVVEITRERGYRAAEGQKPRQRVSVANRKIFARPENICADGI